MTVLSNLSFQIADILFFTIGSNIWSLTNNWFPCAAQTSCNFGLGRIVYEKLPHQQLQGYDDDVVWNTIIFLYLVLFSITSNVLFDFKVRDSSPPMQVLTRCQDLCLRDRTAANNLVRTCSSFDFQPGKRLTLPTSLSAPFTSTSPTGTGNVEYDESVCFLSRELPRPEGLGTLVNLPGHFLYSEVCLSCKFHISYYILDYTFIRTDFPSLKHAIN